jgi:hypothetical protein
LNRSVSAICGNVSVAIFWGSVSAIGVNVVGSFYVTATVTDTATYTVTVPIFNIISNSKHADQFQN